MAVAYEEINNSRERAKTVRFKVGQGRKDFDDFACQPVLHAKYFQVIIMTIVAQEQAYGFGLRSIVSVWGDRR
jgi:hypothetical protein